MAAGSFRMEGLPQGTAPLAGGQSATYLIREPNPPAGLPTFPRWSARLAVTLLLQVFQLLRCYQTGGPPRSSNVSA